MLSFKDLSEKKTKVKINPKQSEITEKCGKTGEDECKCEDKTPAQKSVAGKGASVLSVKAKDASIVVAQATMMKMAKVPT